MKEAFLQEMARFWQSLQFVWGIVKDTLRLVIADSSIIGRAELVVLGLTALVVVCLLVSGIVRFLKAPVKKKLAKLGGFVLALFLLAAVLYFLLRMIGMPTG